MSGEVLKKIKRLLALFFFWVFLVFPFFVNTVKSEIHPHKICLELNTVFSCVDSSKLKEEKISEFWMGLYMNGIKVGYSSSQEFSLIKNGKKYKKSIDESTMKVSRLGGNPVEIISIQESLYDEHGRPLECILRVKMSETETVLKAEIGPEKILFKSVDKVIKELPYEGEFFLDTPIKKIIEEGGLKPGKKYNFKILDPTSYSLVDCDFEVFSKEDVLILGEKKRLWHVKEEVTYIVPISINEWIDESGNSWKSESQASFATITSILMPKEKALEISEENFDIAFSTIIKSNIAFENPQEIQQVTFKLSGISPEKIKKLPFDERSQKIVELGEDYIIIQTSSQVFKEKDAIVFPAKEKKFQRFLKSTSFCQSDDSEIQKVAREIVSQEKNSWKAAKKIAEWVKKVMTPNYDVGFASAKETLKNREGDCSEYTVLTVTLCRAVGIPARAAVGIMYANEIFAYHMWPEVYVGRWISLDAKWLAVDKKSGEYYTDATHIKFGHSLLDENIFKEMAQAISEIVGKLKLEVINYYQDK
ncbi:MAG: transglutaminase domain-containing protein [Candidatus Aminicenantes bacterium]|nr:transglutaminase domain-containing protein [Candidatus Aminicenantes bacterium]